MFFLNFLLLFFFLFLRTLDDQVVNTPDHFKMLSNIVNIKWQSLKTFHRGKKEIYIKIIINDDKLTASVKIRCCHGNGLYPENET